MKRFLLAVALLAALAVGARAQTVDLRLGYGAYTMMDASNMDDGWHADTAWGAMNATLYFRLANMFWIGPSYSYSSAKIGPGHVNYNAFLMNFKYGYYHSQTFDLYGHVACGVEVSHISPTGQDAYNKTYFGMQANPVGIEINLGQFGMFGEMGYGAQGVIQVGVRVLL